MGAYNRQSQSPISTIAFRETDGRVRRMEAVPRGWKSMRSLGDGTIPGVSEVTRILDQILILKKKCEIG
jgi:hypothetical protein